MCAKAIGRGAADKHQRVPRYYSSNPMEGLSSGVPSDLFAALRSRARASDSSRLVRCKSIPGCVVVACGELGKSRARQGRRYDCFPFLLRKHFAPVGR